MENLREWIRRDYDIYKGIIVFGGAFGFVMLLLYAVLFNVYRALEEKVAIGDNELKSLFLTSMELESLNQELKQDKLWVAGDDLTKYIVDRAYQSNIDGTAIDMTESKQEDKKLKMVYRTINLRFKTDRVFPREAIVNFLHGLENNTSRVRVTDFKLEPPKGYTRGERRPDVWRVDAVRVVHHSRMK